MARKIRAKEVLELHAGGLSQNAIAAARRMSKHSVQDVLEAASEHGLSWDDAKDMVDSEVYARLFPGKEPVGPAYPTPTGTAFTGSSPRRA